MRATCSGLMSSAGSPSVSWPCQSQATRLAWILSGYPEVVLRPDDHLAAAELVRRLRRSGQRLPGRGALLWAVAGRIGAAVWSLDRRWQALARRGAPVVEAIA